jgi:hypothetical protein
MIKEVRIEIGATCGKAKHISLFLNKGSSFTFELDL